MHLILPSRPRIWGLFKGYSRMDFGRDLRAAVNVTIMAFPLSVAFAIASGATPEQGLFSAIIGGALIALFSGSPVQIGGPTGAFVVITYGTLHQYGPDGLLLCTALAGLMLVGMALGRLGQVIRFIPFPVNRAFTNGIACLILGSQLKSFLGLRGGDLPTELPAKIIWVIGHPAAIHAPTVALAVGSLLVVLFWPERLARWVPGPMAGLVLAATVVAGFGLAERWQVATIATQFGGISRELPGLHVPHFDWAKLPELVHPAFTIALLVAMQALLCCVVTDGMLDQRHDSNQELLAQGLANLAGPFFGCLPVTGGVARSIANVRCGGRTPVAGLLHSLLLLLLLVLAAPLLGRLPLASLSAILVLSAARMLDPRQFVRLSRWPFSDAAVFLATFALTVLANLTLAVEVGVVLAALLLVKRLAETSQITAVDERNETEHSEDSVLGKDVPPGVVIFHVFGALFFGVVDKLDQELKRTKPPPRVLILRVRKVLAMDATGLQAVEDLLAKLRAKGQHLLLCGLHTQPLVVMQRSGFLDRLGMDNVCGDIDDALKRARELLAPPPPGAGPGR